MLSDGGFALVLWAPGFDEVAAAVFVTSLRSAGVRVKLVSLSRQLACGSHGLGLVPDLSLEDALPIARDALCVVLPCGSSYIPRLALDPRVRELLVLAQANHATVVARTGAEAILAKMALVKPGAGDWVAFSSRDGLLSLAHDLSGALLLTV